MRLINNEWEIACAVHIGHEHRNLGVNCQDAARILVDDDIVIGIGCDGCGNEFRTSSEVGAKLLSLCGLTLLSQGLKDQPVQQAVSSLFPLLVAFVKEQARLTALVGDEAIAHYVDEHWLATIIGFAIKGNDGVLFYQGDGVYCIDDDFVVIDKQNSPPYLAYNAIRNPEKFGVAPSFLSNAFTTVQFDASAVKRIMVASDGFVLNEKPSLNGSQWGKKGQTGLKRWMNVQFENGHFQDDCFVVTAEKRT